MPAASRSGAAGVRKEEGKRIQEETRKMEAKLERLRKTMDAVAAEPATGSSEGRWKSSSASKPGTGGSVKGGLDTRPSTKARTQPRGSAGGGAIGTGTPGAAGIGGSVGSGRPGSQGASVKDLTEGRAGAPQAGSNATASPTQRRAETWPNTAAALQGSSAANQQTAHDKSEDAREVESFLASLKLDRYASIFLESGFDSMDVVQVMEESHMREIGMAVGHIVKLRKKLAELKPAPKQVGPDSAPAAGSQHRSTLQREMSFGGVEEARDAGRAATKAIPDVQFDEAVSAASFQEALRAWREGHDCPGSAAASSKSAAPSEEKLCCYNCYKQFYKQFAVERCSPQGQGTDPRAMSLGSSLGEAGRASAVKRLLCSEACADGWVAAMEKKAAVQRKRQERLETMRGMEQALEEQELTGIDGDLVVQDA